ncbi:hypothetical protein MKW94_001669 [Papaver nudicaule]|uniref:F-box associated beta-propeller type 3 domain-containing protein n=1 Tax=Papaver nudicaule TaxID=74823 RepID=A0AA41RQ59_PAPNU|nr:hypothetical protein [Papaver nudicaule]
MKKIISPTKTRSTEGLRRVPRCFSSITNTALEDRRDYLNNKAVVCDLERLLKDGKRTYYELDWDYRNGIYHSEIDERWENWVYSSHELWKQKNEEEQKRDLDMYWKYLRDYLHRKGIDTSNHRLLLSMKRIETRDPASKSERGGTVEFSIGSPDTGCVSLNRLVLDHSYALPRQSVKGLLCLTGYAAFLIYNPITGETSPWFEIPNNDPQRKRNHIAFGYNPQSDEHIVVCLSGSDKYSRYECISKRPKDQVVEVFTVGKNTWKRIDATPPISITHECPFYVDGCLYWRFRDSANDSDSDADTDSEEGELEQIMRFDIETEKFRVIPIPYFVHKGDTLSQTVELIEVDGRIAVLTRSMSLWKIHEDANGNIKWTKEDICVPEDWNGKPDISIEALTWTNLIFLQSEDWDSILYYNQITKAFIRFPISPDSVPCQWKRIIQV